MREIDKRIGRNILYTRTLRGMTQRELCDRLSELGDDPVSVPTLSSWEHGTRSISAAHLYYLAQALQVVPIELYDGEQLHAQDRARAVLRAVNYSEHERQILRFAALDWTGDTHALIEWIGAYMSMCPDQRADAAGYLIYLYESSLRKGYRLNAPYMTNLKLLKKKLDILEGS